MTTNRVIQLAVYNWVKSEIRPVECGVLQWPGFGHLLFTISMDDICNVSGVIFTYAAMTLEKSVQIKLHFKNARSINCSKHHYINYLKLLDRFIVRMLTNLFPTKAI